MYFHLSHNKGLTIPKGKLESVNQRKTDNKTANEKQDKKIIGSKQKSRFVGSLTSY